MKIENFFNLFLIISSIHGFIFCAVQYFSKQRKTATFIFINLLVLSISLNNFQSWVLVKDFFRGDNFLKYFEIPWHFLIAPFFYLFLVNYLEVEKKKMNILKIILPTFVLFLLVRLGFYFNDNNDGVLVSSIFRKYVVIEEIISSIFSLSIFIYSFKIYKSVRALKEQNDINNFDNLKWIGGFFTLGLLVYIFWFIPLLITIVFDFKVFMPSYYPLRVFTTILIYWLGYQSVLQLRVLKERKYLRKHLTKPSNLSSNNEVLDKKIKNEIHISQEVVDSILKGLEDFENEKQYTLQSITLNSLAKKLNTNTNYLSKVVNHYKEMSYTNYLNTLRINNIVEELYSNPKIRKFTIKAIAQEAGYSNSDSFSKVFYKLKGENPSDFINKLK